MNSNPKTFTPWQQHWFDFKQITKAGLAISVVFSALCGYVLGVDHWTSACWGTLGVLALGGYCMVGASNAFNQVIERDLDALMTRTHNRPVAAGRMLPSVGLLIAGLLTLAGMGLLYTINVKTAFFGGLSIFMYTSLYTPMKRISPLSVFVGAIPGAIPFMLGWVAATDHFGIEAGTLFLIQFFWQFPHFWAIGWLLYDDYEKAGFFMLPTGKRDTSTALQTLLYTAWLIIASLLPVLGWTGRLQLSPMGATCILLLGFWMLYKAVLLYQQRTSQAAKQLMFASIFYITLLQLIYILDKYLHI